MIRTRLNPEAQDANLKSYDATYQRFSWKDVEKEFTWSRTGEINIAYEAVDRWAANRETRDRRALIFEKGGTTTEFSYLQLRESVSRWANMFLENGFSIGDRMFLFLPACPELYFAMLACARLGIIFSPLYATHTFDELEVRLHNGKPKGILTSPNLAERLPRDAMSEVERVFLTEGPLTGMLSGEVLVPEVVEEYPRKSTVKWLRGASPLYLMYTSGSTGPPKGVVHAHQDMLGHLMTGKYVLDLTDRSILWTDGDPAWITGTVYGLFAPLLCGATSLVQADPFSASTWYRTLEKHAVTVWYTTPGTMAKLMEAGEDLPGRYDLSKLVHVATVGDKLTPEQFYWARKTLNRAPHDTWWMTETGMMCLANYPSVSIKPGSMGKPVPGIEAAVLDEKGEPVPQLTLGELALRPGWPSMMTGIWSDPPRYQAYFKFREWFLTGDMVMKDEDGYYYHQGRNDDLIKVGEKLIGPYEIEQVLLLHPAVAEAAVICLGSATGSPVVKAFITITKEFTPSDRLNHHIQRFVSASFKPELPLREVIFLEEMPKTNSGKLLRRVLRVMEQGLPVGDWSKLKEE
jgi:acetyl-CoA synthetase